jgi:cation diffusion facilitator CzcD-associated flavoprotein CzcO
MEFFDYTMDEHFDGAPVPVYLPRSEILQYFTARVPKHCDDFFARYFRFRHRVEHVVWDTTTQHFAVTVRDLVEDALLEEYYDQCVWACGENGKQHVPQDLWQLFVDGKFPGRLLRSADTQRFDEDVRGKRVVMISRAHSAEDLAHMAIKLGVEKVFVVARYERVECAHGFRWPYDKVKQGVHGNDADKSAGEHYSIGSSGLCTARQINTLSNASPP